VRRTLAAATLVLALLAGSARAGTWVVVSTATSPAGAAPADAAALLPIWQGAGAAYGIPWQVLAAINEIESKDGRNMGPSPAGAVGWMQFMPGTWLRFGTDANGDGIADPWNAEDAIYSAARYLAAAGGREDLPRAIHAYNHADWYVQEVLRLARLYGSGGGDAALALDGLRAALDRAQAAVASASEALAAARENAALVAQRRDGLLERAGSSTLFTERLSFQRLAGLAGADSTDAQVRVDAAARRLASAQDGLEQARAQAGAASFDPGAGALLEAPVYAGGYAFPVGGGPGAVSVAAARQDYAAADIAAPEGSPVYAFAAGIVERVATVPDARCGLGFTFRTDDGEAWTYCHLSYVEPGLAPGARLAAGTVVGLVGSTGDATGPELSLQAEPATVRPQELGWFRAFAGSAFRWRGDAPSAAGPVFAIVPGGDPVVAFTLYR
jgi:murein DD-endopeptidase MepM/ murein hydrolase activator NlpD